MKALLLIDIQNDFLPGGALAVNEGDQVIPVAHDLLNHVDFDQIVATQDWHPANHGSFASQHDKNPFEMGELDGLPQIMWPDHCVQNTLGSELAITDLPINKIFTKGTDPSVDSYSAFFDNAKRNSTGLGEWLNQQGITELYVMGLATDYCVKFSVLDALNLGFKVNVVVNGCRAVNPEDGKSAFKEMETAGATLLIE
jgi:nicotinamidase/pyrazinamidase